MGRGIIKQIPPTASEAGILTNENGKDIKFFQPFCKELGLQVGTNVQFVAYVDPNTKEKTGLNVDLDKRAIVVIKDNDTGMIADPNFGEIPAYEPMMKEQGIITGTVVKYDLVQTDQGMTAVRLQIAADQSAGQLPSAGTTK